MNASGRVLAWDGPTRAFKWALVAVVLDGWLSNALGASAPVWHKWNGYGALVLIVFRILWGFAGGSTARFSTFVAGPRRALAYLGGGVKYLGHNPLGGWMALALLALVAVQGVSGLYSADEDRIVIEGPLARTVGAKAVDFAAHWHHLVFNAIEIMVAIHIAASFFYTFGRREPVIAAMIAGEKPAETYVDAQSATPGSWSRASLCLVIAAALVFGAILAAGGRPF